MTSNWNQVNSDYYLVETVATNGLTAKANYTPSTGRFSTFCRDADMLARWEAEAAEMFVPVASAPASSTSAAGTTDIAAMKSATDFMKVGIAARFPGTCAKSGQRFGKGARIEQTCYGWALVGAELDINYNMSREDSMF